MKRTPRTLFLTLVAATLVGRTAGAQANSGVVEITELVPVVSGARGRLCPGPGNAVRATITWSGSAPAPAVYLQLRLLTDGGPPDGALLAEGSTRPPRAPATTTFTFLNVEIPARLRGRGARLAIRAEPQVDARQRSVVKARREIFIDDATDWSCGRGRETRLSSPGRPILPAVASPKWERNGRSHSGWLPHEPRGGSLMIVLERTVCMILRKPLVHRVGFHISSVGYRLHSHQFENAARSIENGHVIVLGWPGGHGWAKYTRNENGQNVLRVPPAGFPTAAAQAQLVHECVHMLQDWNRTRLRTEDDEAIAYIAQMLYLKLATGMTSFSGRLNNDPKLDLVGNVAFAAASMIADGQSGRITRVLIDQLRDAIRRVPKYAREAGRTRVYDGI